MLESTDTVEEIYLERERYLVNTDDLLEEMFGHEIKKDERFPVCINCREFVETATA